MKATDDDEGAVEALTTRVAELELALARARERLAELAHPQEPAPSTRRAAEQCRHKAAGSSHAV